MHPSRLLPPSCDNHHGTLTSTAVATAQKLSPARRRELLLGAALTAAFAALLHAIGPAPGDAPVHLYRTFLVRDGALVWDNFWYAGTYPLASYSLLYYLPAALVGNLPLVFVAAVGSTVLFSSLALREWGNAALWPSRSPQELLGRARQQQRQRRSSRFRLVAQSSASRAARPAGASPLRFRTRR